MNYTKEQLEEIVVHIRLELYNRALPCGPHAIRNRMKDLGITPGPSERTIGRMLDRNALTHRRTGIYAGDQIEKQPSPSPPLGHPPGGGPRGPCALNQGS